MKHVSYLKTLIQIICSYVKTVLSIFAKNGQKLQNEKIKRFLNAIERKQVIYCTKLQVLNIVI